MPPMPGDLLAPGTAPAARPARRVWQRYARDIRRPLTCLLFLLPWAIVYEVGAYLARAHGTIHELVAPTVIRGLLSWFGLVGAWVPPVTLVAALLAWHLVRRDRWRIRPWVLPLMLLECAVMAVPLLVLSALFEAPARHAPGVWTAILKALGAGLYEELVFRLLLIAGLAWLLAGIARVPSTSALWGAVALAAIVFSLCHFYPVGAETFGWQTFIFKSVAGLYLAVVFLGRGLGIAAGCHALCNILLVCFRSQTA